MPYRPSSETIRTRTYVREAPCRVMVCTSRILTRFRSAAASPKYLVKDCAAAAAPRNCRLDRARVRAAFIALNSVHPRYLSGELSAGRSAIVLFAVDLQT